VAATFNRLDDGFCFNNAVAVKPALRVRQSRLTVMRASIALAMVTARGTHLKRPRNRIERQHGPFKLVLRSFLRQHYRRSNAKPAKGIDDFVEQRRQLFPDGLYTKSPSGFNSYLWPAMKTITVLPANVWCLSIGPRR
jgi:hypothetical protein